MEWPSHLDDCPLIEAYSGRLSLEDIGEEIRWHANVLTPEEHYLNTMAVRRRNVHEHRSYDYWAYIAYSSKDGKWAKWLHKRLGNYRIPRKFQDVLMPDGTKLGKHVGPVFFQDCSSEEGAGIRKALYEARMQQSLYLIVICSIKSARSKWIEKEIEDYRKLHGDDGVIALIVDGVPNASSNLKLDDGLECLPYALRWPMEPLIGNLQDNADGKERGFLKILANIINIGFEDLYREHERTQRKQRIIVGVLAAGIIATLTSLCVFAFTY